MTTLLRRGLILLLASVLMILLSAAEVRHYLGHESARTVLLYLNGADIPMTAEALIGSAPLNHHHYHFDAQGLTLRDTGRNAQLPMSLPVNPIEPRLLSRITLRITASAPGAWIAYLRRTADSPILVSQTHSLDAGKQVLTFDFEQILASAHEDGLNPDWRLSEVVLAPYYPADARVTIHDVRWSAGEKVHRDDWRIVSAEQLGTLPGHQLASFHQLRQVNPLLLVPESGISLMALPHWISLCVLLSLTLSALLIDWRLRRPLARLMWLIASIGSVALFDLTGLYQPVNWAVMCVVLLILLFPVSQHASSRWHQVRWAHAGDSRYLAGILLIWSACLVVAWQRPEISGMQVVSQWLIYLPWALIQQVILLTCLMPLCQGAPQTADSEAAMKSPGLVMPAALLFGWLHYPNLILMAGSVALAALIMLLWHRGHGWLVTLSLHATVGTLALGLTPEHWLISGEVGSLWFR